MLMMPAVSSIELKTVENNNMDLIKEKQNTLINKKINKNEVNLLIKDIIQNKLSINKNDIEQYINYLIEFVQKNDLTTIDKNIETKIDIVEGKLNRLIQFIEKSLLKKIEDFIIRLIAALLIFPVLIICFAYLPIFIFVGFFTFVILTIGKILFPDGFSSYAPIIIILVIYPYLFFYTLSVVLVYSGTRFEGVLNAIFDAIYDFFSDESTLLKIQKIIKN
jgi:hypothetical protein